MAGNFGRTPGFRRLIRIMQELQNTEANANRIGLNEKGELDRRTFLQIGGLAALAGTTGALWTLKQKGQSPLQRGLSSQHHSVAIIGGGIAGLNAAYHLKRSGIAAKIFEGSSRIGGRMWTARGGDSVADGITVERGGEFIDTNHREMLWLIKQFGLEGDLIDVQGKSESALEGDAFFLDGALLNSKSVVKDLRRAVEKMIRDRRKAKEDKALFRQIDETPLSQYIESLPVENSTKEILKVAYLTEYGLEVEEQTPWNMINLISFQPYKEFEMFGPSDERFKIRGGNDRLISAMVQDLQSQIEVDHRMEALEKNSDGTYTLYFRGSAPVSADVVLLTIPFNLLKECDLSKAGLPDWKTEVIHQLGYGNNGKVICGFSEAMWRPQGFQGYVFTNSGYQSGWDSSQLQTTEGKPAAYTFYSGGNLAAELANRPNSYWEAQFLGELDAIFPGSRQKFNGRTQVVPWPSFEFFKMSYAAYRVGQYSTLAGKEILPVGNLFFAGEHCSLAFQGYMNGGAITGKKAARDILKALNHQANADLQSEIQDEMRINQTY